MLTLKSREDLVSLEGHEVHDFKVWNPELGQNVDIDRRHGELVPHCGSGVVILKQGGH